MATHDVRNWLKLNLLIDKACLVLRQLFQKSWKTRFVREWSGTQDDIDVILAHRQMKNIGKMQRMTILSGDVNSWDLTTLRVILTSKDFLNLTVKQARNINQLAHIRNQLAHSGSKGISDDELNAHWCSASAILVQFGESEADLELLKQESRVAGVEFIKKEEPINDESTLQARRLKEAGNAQFQMENWAESIKIYTQAILLPGLPSADRATLYSNRSIAFLNNKESSLALEDAKKSIELWPEWWRGHYRMGQIYTEMNKYKKAEACFDEAFAREPQRDEIKEARSYARMKGGQLERNDAMDAHFFHQSIDDVVSEFGRRTACQDIAKAVKKLLHSDVEDDFIRNWQDCQKGNNCQAGADGYPRDYVIAAQYYKKAADRGSAGGLFMLAMLTMEGKGVKRDIQFGISMLKQAAAKPPILNGLKNDGVAEAEYTLGLYYQTGIGVTKNESAAIAWYQKACDHGSVTAANNIGLIYMRRGNFIKAEQYLKMAANAGYAYAMVNLAGYYCSQSDADLALKWCQRARNSGVSGTDIDHIEKSSEDAILQLKVIGVEEWESKNAKNATGLSVKERVKRFARQSDPYLADLIKILDEFEKQVTKNQDTISRSSVRFPPDQLKRYAKRSLYARELWKAQNHFFAAMSAMLELGLSNGLPTAICDKFITELSSCAKIEFLVVALPVELRLLICSLVDHLLTLKNTLHEEICICYIELNCLSSQVSSVAFLTECIRKYPQNGYFIRARGMLYASLGRYEDGIRDITAAIKLEPCWYESLYYRSAMMRLFYPKVSAEETIAAYKEFLAAAPEDHRLVPDSFYGITEMHLAKVLLNPIELHEMHLSQAKHFFNLSVEAERKQLPFFLPYHSNSKATAERVFKTIRMADLHNKQQSGLTKAGKSKTLRKERVFRSALNYPSRENLTKTHRRPISTLYAPVPSDRCKEYSSLKPTKVQKSASSLNGRNAISLNEMGHRQNKVYNIYMLAIIAVLVILFLSSKKTKIED